MPFIIAVAVLLVTSTAYLLYEFRSRALVPDLPAELPQIDAGDDAELKAA